MVEREGVGETTAAAAPRCPVRAFTRKPPDRSRGCCRAGKPFPGFNSLCFRSLENHLLGENDAVLAAGISLGLCSPRIAGLERGAGDYAVAEVFAVLFWGGYFHISHPLSWVYAIRRCYA